MWLLMLVLFNAPMQIERVEILETHWSEKRCVQAVERVRNRGIPKDVNIGCVYVGTIKKT
jgi:hypothetical protein